MQALIFDIKHCAIHDGPGLRTTIFFKGCPLSCWWCHNPESISPEPQEVEEKKRVAVKSFTEKAIIGRKMNINDVFKEIEKDILFFDESKGGVTFSGGEPLMQIEFLTALAKLCNDKDVHTALDTSGYVNNYSLKQVLPYIDLFLYDIKLLDNKMHKKYTGVTNNQILLNLDFLLAQQKKVIIRYPLIPGINSSLEQLEELKTFLSPRVKEIHFLPYHTIARNKYKKIGLDYKLNGIDNLSDDFINAVKQNFIQSDFTVKIGG